MNRSRRRRKSKMTTQSSTPDMPFDECTVPAPTRLVESTDLPCHLAGNQVTQSTSLEGKNETTNQAEVLYQKGTLPEADGDLPSTSNAMSTAESLENKKRKLESNKYENCDNDEEGIIPLEELTRSNEHARDSTDPQQPKRARLQHSPNLFAHEQEESYEERFDDAMESLLGNQFVPPFSPSLPPSLTSLPSHPSQASSLPPVAPVTPSTVNMTQDDITIVAEVQATRPEVIDLETTPTLRRGSSFVVDLTAEPNSPEREVVDLTGDVPESNTDSTPVIVCVSRIFQRAPSLTWQRPSCMFETIASDAMFRNLSPPQLSDDEIQEVTEESPTTSSSVVAEASSSTATSKNDDTPKRTITCPICMDDERTIKRRKRQLSSTVCGHVFCDQCIKNAVKIQGKCPTCRKKLTLRQLHPIFISLQE